MDIKEENFNTGLINRGNLSPTDFIAGNFSPLIWEKVTDEQHNFWLNYIPVYEVQNNFGVDKMNCTTMCTDNAIETNLKQQTGHEINISDRYVSVVSGNTTWGNYVDYPIISIMKLGFVMESEYPEIYKKQPPTWDEYYESLPPTIPPLAASRLKLYEFDKEFIYPANDSELLYKKLSESPIGVTVRYASSDNSDDILNPVGTQNHNILIVGAKYKEYWIMYDSYAWQRGLPTLKKYAWSYPFGSALRIHVKATNNNTTYMFKQNFPYLLVEGNEQKIGFFLDGRMVVDQDWSKIIVQSASRLGQYQPPIPLKLVDWNSVPHVSLKGEIIN